MTVISTRIRVAPDGAISIADPLPPGEHQAVVTVATAPKPRRSVRDMIVHHGPWNDRVSLRREEMYGDEGR